MGIDNMYSKTMSNRVSKELLHKWDSILTLMNSEVIKVHEVNINEADKFKFDFNGLLNSLNVPSEFWYIHCRANGFNCSTDYIGKTSIVIIDVEYLTKVSNVFNNRSYS